MTTEQTPSLEDMIRAPSPQDVIGAMVALAGLETFPSDRRRLHDFVRRSKDGIPGADRVLTSFVFSEGADLYPFSRTLENTLVHLQLGGVIFAKNPEFNRLGMTAEVRASMRDKLSGRFDQEGLRVLQQLAEAFRDEFSE